MDLKNDFLGGTHSPGEVSMFGFDFNQHSDLNLGQVEAKHEYCHWAMTSLFMAHNTYGNMVRVLMVKKTCQMVG